MFVEFNNKIGEIMIVDSDGENTIKIDDDYVEAEFFIVEHRGEVRHFDKVGLNSYLQSVTISDSECLSVTMYNVSSQFKLGELTIGERVELRLFTYEFRVYPLVEIFKRYYKNNDKAYKYEYNFYADNDTINQWVYHSYDELSKVLDGVEEDYIHSIVLRDKNDNILAIIKDFDEKEDLYSLTITGDYKAVEPMIDIFEYFFS